MSIPKGKRYLGVASQARIKFQDASDDVRSFYTLRQMLKGRKAAVPHLHNVAKGVYVLIAALWEAYIEDLAIESATLLVENACNWEQLPLTLQKGIAKEVREDKHDLSPWKLAGEGWRAHCLSRVPALVDTGKFNTPKPSQIDELFFLAIGLRDLTTTWTGEIDGVSSRDRLKTFMEIRGSIAHGGAPPVEVSPRMISDFYQAVMSLVEETDEAIRAFVTNATGVAPWEAPTSGSEHETIDGEEQLERWIPTYT